MKSETQIAKENVRDWENLRITKEGNSSLCCREHLASCQRFLDKMGLLREEILDLTIEYGDIRGSIKKLFYEIQKDLQNAIKTYNEVGLK